MGCIDTIIGRCPKCKTPFEIQTKLSEHMNRNLAIGDKFSDELEDVRILLKDKCGNGHKIIMILEGEKIAYFETLYRDYDFMELSWGIVIPEDIDS